MYCFNSISREFFLATTSGLLLCLGFGEIPLRHCPRQQLTHYFFEGAGFRKVISRQYIHGDSYCYTGKCLSGKHVCLVTRRRQGKRLGKETSDPENGRQCPFFEELHAVFTERARNMQHQLLESEAGSSVKKKLKRPRGDRSSDESDDEEDDVEESDDEKHMRIKKRKSDDKRQQSQRTTEKSRAGISSIHGLLQDFLVQQQRMDIQWREMMERRAQERLIFEQEWRQSMQKLEQERLMLEHSWMEREEQRRMREEARAEKRDALLTTLLNKLLQEDL